jgi:hypothetical protein
MEPFTIATIAGCLFAGFFFGWSSAVVCCAPPGQFTHRIAKVSKSSDYKTPLVNKVEYE